MTASGAVIVGFLLLAALLGVRPRIAFLIFLFVLPFHYWVKLACDTLPTSLKWLGTYWKELFVLLFVFRLFVGNRSFAARFPINSTLAGVVLFQLVVFARSMFWDDWRVSIVGMGFLLAYSALFYIIAGMLGAGDVRRVLQVFIVTVFIVSVIGLLEFAFDFSVTGSAWLGSMGENTRRIRSVIGAAIPFASFIALMLPLFLVRFLIHRGFLARVAWGAAGGALICALLLTYSRGPMLQAVVGCAGVLWFYGRRLIGPRLVYLCIGVFCVALAGSRVVAEKDVLIDRVTAIFSPKDAGNDIRLRTYARILPDIQSVDGVIAALVGRGTGKASNALMLGTQSGEEGGEFILDIESSLLKIFFEAGILGIGAFAYLYFSVLRAGWFLIRQSQHREQRASIVAVTCAVAAFPIELAVNRLIDCWIISATMWTFFTLLYVLRRDLADLRRVRGHRAVPAKDLREPFLVSPPRAAPSL